MTSSKLQHTASTAPSAFEARWTVSGVMLDLSWYIIRFKLMLHVEIYRYVLSCMAMRI